MAGVITVVDPDANPTYGMSKAINEMITGAGTGGTGTDSAASQQGAAIVSVGLAQSMGYQVPTGATSINIPVISGTIVQPQTVAGTSTIITTPKVGGTPESVTTVTHKDDGSVVTISPTSTVTRNSTGVVTTVNAPAPTVIPVVPTQDYYKFSDGSKVSQTQYDGWTPQQQFNYQKSIGGIDPNAVFVENKDGSWGYSKADVSTASITGIAGKSPMVINPDGSIDIGKSLAKGVTASYIESHTTASANDVNRAQTQNEVMSVLDNSTYKTKDGYLVTQAIIDGKVSLADAKTAGFSVTQSDVTLALEQRQQNEVIALDNKSGRTQTQSSASGNYSQNSAGIYYQPIANTGSLGANQLDFTKTTSYTTVVPDISNLPSGSRPSFTSFLENYESTHPLNTGMVSGNWSPTQKQNIVNEYSNAKPGDIPLNLFGNMAEDAKSAYKQQYGISATGSMLTGAAADASSLLIGPAVEQGVNYGWKSVTPLQYGETGAISLANIIGAGSMGVFGEGVEAGIASASNAVISPVITGIKNVSGAVSDSIMSGLNYEALDIPQSGPSMFDNMVKGTTNLTGSVSRVLTSSFGEPLLNNVTGNLEPNIITGTKLVYTPPAWADKLDILGDRVTSAVSNYATQMEGGISNSELTSMQKYPTVGNPNTVNPDESMIYTQKIIQPLDISHNLSAAGDEEISFVRANQVKEGMGIGAEKIDTGIGEVNIDNPIAEYPGKYIISSSAKGTPYVSYVDPTAPPQSVIGGIEDQPNPTDLAMEHFKTNYATPEAMEEASAKMSANFNKFRFDSNGNPINLITTPNVNLESSPIAVLDKTEVLTPEQLEEEWNKNPLTQSNRPSIAEQMEQYNSRLNSNLLQSNSSLSGLSLTVPFIPKTLTEWQAPSITQIVNPQQLQSQVQSLKTLVAVQTETSPFVQVMPEVESQTSLQAIMAPVTSMQQITEIQPQTAMQINTEHLVSPAIEVESATDLQTQMEQQQEQQQIQQQKQQTQTQLQTATGTGTTVTTDNPPPEEINPDNFLFFPPEKKKEKKKNKKTKNEKQTTQQYQYLFSKTPELDLHMPTGSSLTKGGILGGELAERRVTTVEPSHNVEEGVKITTRTYNRTRGKRSTDYRGITRTNLAVA